MKFFYTILMLVLLSGCASSQKNATIRYDADVSNIKFDFGKHNIDNVDKITLNKFVTDNNIKYDSYLVGVVGRTDFVNSNNFNADLGLKRAQATAKYLQSKGDVVAFVQSMGETDDVVIEPYVGDMQKGIAVRVTNRSVTLITIHKVK